MSFSSLGAQSGRVLLPSSAATATVPNASSSTAIDLRAYRGQLVLLKVDTKTHIKAGTSSVAAAAATDYYLTADQDYLFRVEEDRDYIRVFGASAAGNLFYYAGSP
jgi:hypothetical protein